MNIQNNISLKDFNTFGIQVNAKRFVSVNSLEALKTVLKSENDVFLLGGGSNLLLTKDIDKLVIHLNLKGIQVLRKEDNFSYIKAQAGENWHAFVRWCLENNYGGLENLSLIPGNVGTSPIQNIGAYGVELKDYFQELEAIEIATGKLMVFRKDECEFGYRNSVFKNELKNKFIIVSVTFKLTNTNHQIHSTYGAIKTELGAITQPTIKDVSNAVIAIRQRKLPDPAEIGNSGSFFKNPVVSNELFLNIQNKYANMPFYRIDDNRVKIPAGWLIEQCGFKGKRYGDAGVHANQALVLVNYNNATGQELKQLALKIKKTVSDTFNIDLEVEVNII